MAATNRSRQDTSAITAKIQPSFMEQYTKILDDLVDSKIDSYLSESKTPAPTFLKSDYYVFFTCLAEQYNSLKNNSKARVEATHILNQLDTLSNCSLFYNDLAREQICFERRYHFYSQYNPILMPIAVRIFNELFPRAPIPFIDVTLPLQHSRFLAHRALSPSQTKSDIILRR